MFIIESIIFMIKVLIFGVISSLILIFIISIVKTKSENTNSTTTYNNNDNNDERFFIKDESVPSPTPQFTISVTTETTTPKRAREWDSISQEEIDSVKCYGDNMSKHDYKIRAKYIPTKRMRTITVNAFDETDALSQLDSDFDKDSATIAFSEYPQPTERQIQYAIYLGIEIPEKCCQYDLSALLSQRTTQPVPAALTNFALTHGICFSYYGDEPYLIDRIGLNFKTQEWIAFALACMNRHINKSWDFSEWENYLTFGLECMNNTSFMNSLKRAPFHDDGFYGFEYGEYSHDTIFYKTLRKYIIDN